MGQCHTGAGPTELRFTLNGATPKAFAGSVKSQPSANGLRTILMFQRVGSQRYFDTAGFPGRTLGLDEDGKTKTAGKAPPSQLQ